MFRVMCWNSQPNPLEQCSVVVRWLIHTGQHVVTSNPCWLSASFPILLSIYSTTKYMLLLLYDISMFIFSQPARCGWWEISKSSRCGVIIYTLELSTFCHTNWVVIYNIIYIYIVIFYVHHTHACFKSSIMQYFNYVIG